MRAVESIRLAQRSGSASAGDWWITRTWQPLAVSQFGEPTVQNIEQANGSGRLYAVHKQTPMALVAAKFKLHGGPQGAPLIEELALARLRGQPDQLAYLGACLLLERLHDVASKHSYATDLWLDGCTGATIPDLHALGFEHMGYNGGSPEFRRRDSASTGERLIRTLRAAERVLDHIREMFP